MKFPWAVLFFLAPLLLCSCEASRGRLYERVEALRFAGIKVYSGEELSAVDKEVLIAEFRTTEVSLFRIQERRDVLLKLYRKQSTSRKKKLAERRRRARATDSHLDSFSGAPHDREYWSRRRARGRKD
jgi:hypothetical protein